MGYKDLMIVFYFTFRGNLYYCAVIKSRNFHKKLAMPKFLKKYRMAATKFYSLHDSAIPIKSVPVYQLTSTGRRSFP